MFTGLFHASLDLQSKPLQLHTQGQTVGRLDKNGAEKRDREKTRVKGMFQMGWNLQLDLILFYLDRKDIGWHNP